MASEDPSSTASLLDRLPDELWLEILSHLDYFDLHRTRRVCKRMDGWIKQPSLDYALFRSPPSPSPLKKGTTVSLHPLFHRIESFDSKPIFASLAAHKGQHNLLKFPALLAEYATRPACTKMTLIMELDEEEVWLKNDAGITVKQFLEELHKHWCAVARWVAEEGEEDEEVDLSAVKWKGWEDVKVEKDGEVIASLDTTSFDGPDGDDAAAAAEDW
ncbi:hypothetical protein JCM8097_008986 [Rhodosporidiobolus ruineniae]